MPCFINENWCLIADDNDVLFKAESLTYDLACIYQNELLSRFDNTNKLP